MRHSCPFHRSCCPSPLVASKSCELLCHQTRRLARSCADPTLAVACPFDLKPPGNRPKRESVRAELRRHIVDGRANKGAGLLVQPVAAGAGVRDNQAVLLLVKQHARRHSEATALTA